MSDWCVVVCHTGQGLQSINVEGDGAKWGGGFIVTAKDDAGELIPRPGSLTGLAVSVAVVDENTGVCCVCGVCLDACLCVSV